MIGADLGATGTAFGEGTAQDVEDLNKALTAGYGRGGDQSDGGIGAPLRVESLESTLKVITYSERHIVFWRDIPKLPAFNTVEEFNQLNSYGNNGGMFVPEGIAPQESDSTYTRKTVQVKYVGSLRRVTHQMTLVRPAHGDVIALETMNGTREILRTVEQALFTGNSACVSTEWDGIEKQFTDGIGATDGDQNIVDMRGQPLGQSTLSEAARVVIDNFGFPTALYCGYEAMTDLNNLFITKERQNLGQSPNGGVAGFNLEGYTTAGGQFGFRPSVFLKPGAVAPVVAVGVSGSIPAVTGVTAAVTQQVDATSLLPAGTYGYSVVLENRFGATAEVVAAAPIALTTGNAATITISGLTGTTATAIRLYRTTGTAGTASRAFVKRIPLVPGATQAIVDRNFDIPGTAKAYLLQVDLDVMSFKQLAPFTKIPLATIDPSIRWMQLLYGTPSVYAPRKIVLLKNIGRAS
jgi:hypothetical protein